MENNETICKYISFKYIYTYTYIYTYFIYPSTSHGILKFYFKL